MTITVMTAVDSVANSALARWKSVGHFAAVVPWAEVREKAGIFDCCGEAIVEAVVVPSTKVIECIVQENPDWALVLNQIYEVSNLGWTITVLAPLSEMGAAHEGLRGSGARLQGWWQRAGHEVSFGRMEIA